MRYYSMYYCKMRYFYFFLMIMCVLFVFIGCDDENEKELPFVTNVSIADADKIFRPGDAVVVKAEGFLESDDIRLNIKWILSEESSFLKEGYAIGECAVVIERSSTSIRFLAPGHYPASRVEILLHRQGKTMLLGEISVADGQSPEELQLYGIINSRSNTSKPYGIDHIDLKTGAVTEIKHFTEGEDFSLITNIPGSWKLCGLLKRDSKSFTAFYDLSMNYWQYEESLRPVTFCTTGNEVLVAYQIDDETLSVRNISGTFFSRTLPSPPPPLFKLPEGIKPEALSLYPGIFLRKENAILLSADNRDGTFSPLILNLSTQCVSVCPSVKAKVLIPFGMAVQKGGKGSISQSAIRKNDDFEYVAGYVVSGENGEGTKLCLWNMHTMKMEAPFAVFPNLARSVSTSFMGDLKTQKIYFLFDTNRGGRLIYTYALDTKEWNALSNIGFPYSEIVLAR